MSKFLTIKTYYEDNMKKGLPEYGVLGWESETAQRLRFDMLLSSVELEGKRLLDVGCGTGNLLEYINGEGISVDYTGVDILEVMIERAENKKLKGRFIKADIFENNVFSKDSFDVVYSSGIFNLNLGNNKSFLTKALGVFFKVAAETVVFNLLHYMSPDREDKYFYFDPEEVREVLDGFADSIARAEFIETYLKNDFTVICRKTVAK